jgi:hypothetical protein
MSYALTKIKTFHGMEGYGLNAVITRDGKPIAFVLDEGCGGDTEINFRNPLNNPKSFRATTNESAAREEKDMRAWAMARLSDSERAELGRYAETFKANRDSYIGHNAIVSWVNKAVDDHANKKRFDRMAKTKTLFRLNGDPAERWRTVNAPYGEKVQKFLDTKYAGKVESIYGVAGGDA